MRDEQRTLTKSVRSEVSVWEVKTNEREMKKTTATAMVIARTLKDAVELLMAPPLLWAETRRFAIVDLALAPLCL